MESLVLDVLYSNTFCVLACIIAVLGALSALTLLALVAVENFLKGFHRLRARRVRLLMNLLRRQFSVASFIALLAIGSTVNENGAPDFWSAVVAGSAVTCLLITLTRPMVTFMQKLIATPPAPSSLPARSAQIIPLIMTGRDLQKAA